MTYCKTVVDFNGLVSGVVKEQAHFDLCLSPGKPAQMERWLCYSDNVVWLVALMEVELDLGHICGNILRFWRSVDVDHPLVWEVLEARISLIHRKKLGYIADYDSPLDVETRAHSVQRCRHA